MSSAVITPNRKINPLLAAYLNQLAKKPLLTKSVTAGSFILPPPPPLPFPACLTHIHLIAILNLLQEYTATHLSVSKPLPLTAGLDLKALKLSAYGFFISAPLAHLLFGRLQKMFAGKTGSAAKLGMLVASNLLAVPIQSAGSSCRFFHVSRSFRDGTDPL
jgi:peroxisomal membrane protein 2